MENDLSNLSGQRLMMQQLKSEAFSTQILERVLIRKEQLESLLNEELEASTRLDTLRDGQLHQAGSLGLETALIQKLSDIERQKRDADVQCWRDVGIVIPHLLNAVEAAMSAQARDGILNPHPMPQKLMVKVQPRAETSAHYVQQYQRRTP